MSFIVPLRVLRAPQWIHFAILPLAMMDRATLTSPSDLGRAVLAVCAASCSCRARLRK